MKANFLFFLTASFKIPHEGYKECRLTIEKVDDPTLLPIAHTCSKLLGS